jgi:hypothetical protein
VRTTPAGCWRVPAFKICFLTPMTVEARASRVYTLHSIYRPLFPRLLAPTTRRRMDCPASTCCAMHYFLDRQLPSPYAAAPTLSLPPGSKRRLWSSRWLLSSGPICSSLSWSPSTLLLQSFGLISCAANSSRCHTASAPCWMSLRRHSRTFFIIGRVTVYMAVLKDVCWYCVILLGC